MSEMTPILIPQEIVNATCARYIEVYERLTGTQWRG